MNKLRNSEPRQIIIYSLYFLLASLLINYIYRLVFHSIPIDKIIVGSDMEGYYQYLFHFFVKDWALFDRMPWTIPYGDSKTLSVFTCGLAILWSPFFLMAHLISIFCGLPADGKTNLYYGFILVGGIIYTYVGLVFLYKLLCRYFSRRTSLLTTSLFFLTTNVFFYSVLLGAGMSHIYSFAMISIYMYFSHRFIEKQSLKNLILLGIPFALAVLIRPTNIISGLYLFLMGVSDWKSLKERYFFWLKNYWAIIALFVIGIVVFLPQMLYWHYVTGKYLVYSYQEYGFPNWKLPKFGIVLFGKYNGWLTYTPIVAVALAGLFIQLWRKQMNSLAILLILFFATYVNASWWVPTFSAAVGQRAMIDFLPFLAIPLAFMLNYWRKLSLLQRFGLGAFLLILVFYNIQFGFRYNSGLWWDTPMTWSKFWTTLGF
jgi:hypothetical protein